VIKAAGNKKQNKKYGTSSDDLFVRIHLNKTNVYKGEHIIATVKIYTRVGLLGFEDMKQPSFTGFWTKDISSPSQISLNREKFNGKIYDVGLLKQSIIFPQKTGKLKISPLELKLSIKEKVGQGRDFFGRMVDKYERVLKKIVSNSPLVTVKAIPGNRPENFTGIVGTNFTVNAKIENSKIKTEEGTNITIKINGNGNLNLLENLNIKIPKAFETFDPKIKENIKYSSSGASGSKTYEYFLLARKPGKHSIAPIKFSFFDIKSKTFKKLKTDSFIVDVEGEISKNQNANLYNSQSEVETLHKDIKFIKENNYKLSEKGKNTINSNNIFYMYGLALFGFAGIVILKRKQIRENADIAKMKTKKANKISKKRLKSAGLYLKENNKTEFYKEVLKASWGYMSDKLSIPVSELTKDNIKSVLNEKNIENELSDEFISMLDTCEYAQYAPVGENETPKNTFKKAEKLITKFEKKL
jgi:hypothetical protein